GSSLSLCVSICYIFLLRHSTLVSLFPFTPLFRSPVAQCAGVGADQRPVLFLLVAGVAVGDRCGRPGARRSRSGRPHRSPTATPADRKSTRLNSSHVKISYAVFCLKKKKKNKKYI